MRNYFSGKTVLITGGTGSLGSVLVEFLHKRDVKKICVLSRSEDKHVELKRSTQGIKVRSFVGDVCNFDRLSMAFIGIDIVIHAAAMKHVDLCEYNPTECALTNVIGTKNVIDAAIINHVKKVLFISSDKAVNPTNIYGASKLMGERLILGAETYAGENGTIFAIARFGNFKFSSGSVLKLWEKFAEKHHPLPITNRKMTRFWIGLDEAAMLCVEAIRSMQDGDIFIPKMERKHLTVVAHEYWPKAEFVDIPERPREKVHEEMIIESEIPYITEMISHFVIHRNMYHAQPMLKEDFIKMNYILK